MSSMWYSYPSLSALPRLLPSRGWQLAVFTTFSYFRALLKYLFKDAFLNTLR